MAATDAEYLSGLADWFDAVRMQYTDMENNTHDPAERLRRIARTLPDPKPIDRATARAIAQDATGTYWPEATRD